MIGALNWQTSSKLKLLSDTYRRLVASGMPLSSVPEALPYIHVGGQLVMGDQLIHLLHMPLNEEVNCQCLHVSVTQWHAVGSNRLTKVRFFHSKLISR